MLKRTFDTFGHSSLQFQGSGRNPFYLETNSVLKIKKTAIDTLKEENLVELRNYKYDYCGMIRLTFLDFLVHHDSAEWMKINDSQSTFPAVEKMLG